MLPPLFPKSYLAIQISELIVAHSFHHCCVTITVYLFTLLEKNILVRDVYRGGGGLSCIVRVSSLESCKDVVKSLYVAIQLSSRLVTALPSESSLKKRTRDKYI